MAPSTLRKEIAAIKRQLNDPNAPFGVDLLLPQVGGNSRKTNYDYTGGSLMELIDIIIEEKVKIFVSAVGVPPPQAVEKLHKAGVILANMVGSPRNAEKAIEAGMQILIAQGTEAGGHTGDIATMPLIRHVKRVMEKYGNKNKFGLPLHVVAAGGIADGNAVAAALMLGAEAVWVGTRFICAEESGGSQRYRDTVMNAGPNEVARTLVMTGRPVRLFRTPYIKSWDNRQEEMRKLCDQGIIPVKYDVKQAKAAGKTLSIVDIQPLFCGQVVGLVKKVQPAREIVDELVSDAAKVMRANQGYLVSKAKL